MLGSTQDAMIEVSDLHKSFGALKVLKGIAFEPVPLRTFPGLG